MPSSGTAVADPPQPVHILPAPFSASNVRTSPPTTTISNETGNADPNDLTLLTQGAEALVYRGTFLTPSTPCALKYRPPKPYRHPLLDKRLTRARILAEARVLVKARKEGVGVPGVLGIDWEAGWLALEWIPGITIRRCLDRFLHTLPTSCAPPSSSSANAAETPEDAQASLAQRCPQLWDLMTRVGRAVGRMHEIGVVHGDLTTSNLMLRPPASPLPSSSSSDAEQNLEGSIVLVDFGLAVQSIQDEDRAVDLYVLERAFAATHPAAEPLFREVLRCYGESYRGAKVALRRLEEVRLRGRKRSMIG